MKWIEKMLQDAIGLDTASIGSEAIARATRNRMRLLLLDTTSNYVAYVQRNPTELSALVESVVVLETYFFRHAESFSALVQFARERLALQPQEALRILSAPCATGEEPYSIAMALFDAGIAPANFAVDAVDIHANALVHAETGIYGANSFRGRELAFRQRHFTPHAEAWQIQSEIRNQVRFLPGNILSDAAVLRGHRYHFIFCRNLLIYLDESTRKGLLARLRQQLAAAGLLFLSPVEMPFALANGYRPCANAQVSVCRPSLAAHSDNSTLDDRTKAVGKPSVPRLAGQIVQTTALEHARQVLQDGHLDEAMAICEASLREHGASAEAYSILGLANFLGGEVGKAAEFYRRALYLEPNHLETLTNWSDLLKREGDAARSRLLSRRAERVKSNP